ncbi:MAG: type II secretion system protein GspM [Gammaproteobacteria bacterium]
MKLPEPIGSWYAGLAPRERNLVIAGAVVVVLLIIYLAAVQPLVSAHRSLNSKLQADRSLLAYMDRAAGRLGSAPSAAGTGHLTGGSVFSAVSAATQDSSISNAVQRLEQANNGGVRLTLASVPFDALVQWLQKLADSKGITATSASIQGAQAPGTVDVTLELNARS